MKKIIPIVTIWTLLLSSCATSNDSAKDDSIAKNFTSLESYYSQELVWKDCKDDKKFQCAEIYVPIDYQNPGDASLTLALKKLSAKQSANKVGSLLINPGGPGGSGTDYVTYAEDAFGKRLMDSFDIVGFDPRGVAQSTPLDCLTDQEVDEFIAFDGTPDNEQELKASLEISINLANSCESIANNLIAHVGTQEAARDMDIIRELVGDEKLNFLGASYGTYLGGMYAEIFPDKVGRLVLDGAVDPSLSGEEQSFDQAVGLDTALKRFVEDCPQYDDCPLTKRGDGGVQEIREFLDSLDAKPLKTEDPDRLLTQAMGVYAVAGFLYSDEWWSYMRQSLATAFKGDGTDLLSINDLFNERNDDGTYATNATEAIYAINCFDEPSTSTEEQVREYAKTWIKDAPVFGDYLAWGNLSCSIWPVKDPNPINKFVAQTAAPIVVVGTKYDPATPYKWAVGLSSQLVTSVLLTYEGDGHTAYMRGSKCIDNEIENYLVDGIVPSKNITCPAIRKAE
ncbi:MAG: alpha/beta fold hydrolase [Candidatus Nanopelagicales bacterium]|nr:alpha/beta fold hydrolase [Candidatus Nanopelagicales bacterium]